MGTEDAGVLVWFPPFPPNGSTAQYLLRWITRKTIKSYSKSSEVDEIIKKYGSTSRDGAGLKWPPVHKV